jgi:Ca2+-binding RTX toxin-like protein
MRTRRTLVFAAGLALLGTLGVTPARSAVPQCFGQNVTINGDTDGDGAIIGTSGNDVIRGTNADDYIFGRGGNDRICALDGKDNVFGEAGNDRMNGGDKDDFIDGAGGSDTAVGGPGEDFCRAETVKTCEVP